MDSNASRSHAVPPALPLLVSEPWRALYAFYEYARLRSSPDAAKQPRGDGHVVILFPGLASDVGPLLPLRSHCCRLGYDAIDWGRGLNTGPGRDIDCWLAELALHLQERVAQRLVNAADGTVSLIGWSLGGLYAREVAKLWPDQVRQVITIGTPFNGEPCSTHARHLYRWLNGAAPSDDRALLRRLRVPPPQPTTSIFSRRDGIVAWQACTHHAPRAGVQDIEVSGSHLGMGWNPQVLAVVADRLAQPPGRWRPYRRAR
jgi:pimeloyl-ACP methyl ester carboxylesterase